MFFLYDINNKIDIQFCVNTFYHVISFFFNTNEYNILALVYLGHCTTFTCIVYQCKQYRLYGRKTHKKELIFISTRYIVVAYIVVS